MSLSTKRLEEELNVVNQQKNTLQIALHEQQNKNEISFNNSQKPSEDYKVKLNAFQKSYETMKKEYYNI